MHDIAAARELVLPTLYPHAARGLPVLADKGYTGAGIGVHVPVRHHPEGPLHLDNSCDNRLITALRAHRTQQRPARPLAHPRPRRFLPSAHQRNCCRRTRPDITRPRIR